MAIFLYAFIRLWIFETILKPQIEDKTLLAIAKLLSWAAILVLRKLYKLHLKNKKAAASDFLPTQVVV